MLEKVELEVLIPVMNQHDYSIVDKMNIQSDAIIINQCDINDFEDYTHNQNRIRFFSFNEKGVGLSRNNALIRALGEICLFSDDDVVYKSNYKDTIIKSFKDNPQADVIIFNLPSLNKNRPSFLIQKNKRIHFFNTLRYATPRIAIRRDSIYKANIYFSLLFGGGAKYSCGEDSIFLSECLRKGLKIYSNSSIIGYVSQDDSSWFDGYTKKYFFDKGALFYCLVKHKAWLLCIQFLVRHRKLWKGRYSFHQELNLMKQGMNDFSGKSC